MIFTTTPPQYASVNDNLIWVLFDANANDATKLNYKYVVEVWVNGAKVYTERTYPRPTSGFGIVDMGAIIRGYINSNFTPGIGIVAQQSGAGDFCTPSIVINVREEYNGTTGAIVLTDTARVFFNHYNDRGEFQTAIAAYTNQPLTNRGSNIDLLSTSAYYFIPYFSTTTAAFTVVINGVSTTVTPTAANTMQLINIAVGAIANYTAIIGGVTYYVNVVPAGLYKNYTLHFQNKYGGFESMLFNKVHKRSLDIEKKEFKQLPYRVDSSGVTTFANGIISNEQRTTFAAKFNEKLNIQTDLLADIDYSWLYQLNVSTMVWLEDNGQLHPVSITSSNYAFREWIVDKLTTLQLDIEFTTNRNTQYR